MTLRVSFHKTIMETLRRHLAAVLITVLTFLIHIITFFLNIQNALETRVIEDALSSYYPPTRGMEYINRELLSLSAPSMANAVVAMLLGVYLAFDFFKHMHSKKQTDFYQSLPIRRQNLFFTIFSSCAIIFLLLASVTTVIEIGIIYSTGYGSIVLMKNMLWNLLCMLGVFFACWMTTTLAMILTGHSVIAFLGVGVFSVYIPVIIRYLVPVYAERFFNTYVYNDSNTFFLYFSPVTLGYKLMHNWDAWTIEEHWPYLVGIWVFALIVGIISYLLFLRRPSESAGRAMAFERFNFIIRFSLVIPLALYIGFFLSEMTTNESMPWLIFGIVFSAFLLHGIMECIFHFDIRALLKKKRQLLLSIVICLGFVFIFYTDLFGYDKYIPDVDDVAYIEIDTYLHGFSYNAYEFQRDGLTGEALESAIKVAQELKDNQDIYDESLSYTYHLKNGTTLNKVYYFSSSSVPKLLDELATTEDFKNDFCGLYDMSITAISATKCSNGINEQELDLTQEELEKLREIYLEELTQMTYTQLLNQSSEYQLVFELGTRKYYNDKTEYVLTDRYNVYSGFEQTIEFLKEHGIKNFYDDEELKLMNMDMYEEFENFQRYISDEEKLSLLKEYIIPAEFMSYVYDGEKYVYCDLNVDLNGSSHYIGAYIDRTFLESTLK